MYLIGLHFYNFRVHMYLAKSVGIPFGTADEAMETLRVTDAAYILSTRIRLAGRSRYVRLTNCHK